MTILLHLATTGADTGAADASDGGSIFSFLLLPLMLVAMYFLIIRPNSKKRKAQQTLQSALGVGDEVITTAGIIGTITGEDGPTRFWLEIDDDVQVRIARGGIAGRLDPDALESEKPDDDTSTAGDPVAPALGDDVENSDEVADRDS
ncbi:MAG: preprotein translocase subunit YajC [Ilumatobacter sp.]|uniref:preprotein translocase subunit YajC n=1 Tax=Ilumatobacter sp. TaxID=1967498 RepID=UPI003297A201